jgi:hypothetical protein
MSDIHFPEDLINPNKKDSAWTTQVAESIYREWEHLGVDSFCKGATRYQENREYSLGKQDVEKHKDLFKLSDDPSNSWASLDWRPIPILPKFRRIVNEKHGQMHFGIGCDAIDPISMSEKKAYEATETANIMMRDQLSSMGVDTSILDSGEFDQPKTMEELAMKMEFSYKHNSAIDIEKRIDLIFSENRIHDYIMPQVRRDLFECGLGVTKDYIDPYSGKIKVRRVRPENFGVSPIVNDDGSDATYFFEIVYYSPGELQKHCPWLTDEELNRIVKNNRTAVKRSQWLGDSSPYDDGGLISDQMRIPVMEFEYKTTDRHVYQVSTSEDGFPLVSRAPWERQFKKKYANLIEVEDIDCWYKGSWVVGSDFSFDFGPVEHQKTSGDESQSSFTMYAPELNEMETWSIVDSLKEIVDRIQFAWLKLSNVINKARPKGILIELSSLEDIDIGTGEDLSPIGVMELYEQTGNLVYRRQTFAGEYSNGRPIEELNNGIGTEAQEWFVVLQNYFGFIRDMLGINEVSDGSTPPSRLGKGVAEMANQASTNAIHFLLRAERSIHERLAMSVSIRSEDAIFLGFDEHYQESLGTEHIKSINEENAYAPRVYGYKIYEKPTGDQLMELKADLMKAVESKEITMADKIIIENISNIKQAQQRLAYAVKVNAERIQREKLEAITVQSEEIQKQNESAAQAKMTEWNAKGEAEVRVEMERGKQNRMTLQEKYKLENRYGIHDAKNNGSMRGDYKPGSNSKNESSSKQKKAK